MLLIPPVLACQVIDTAERSYHGLWQEENIVSLSVGNVWVYNSKLFAFGALMKESYQEVLKSVSPCDLIPSPTTKIFKLAMIREQEVPPSKIKDQRKVNDQMVHFAISGRSLELMTSCTPGFL